MVKVMIIDDEPQIRELLGRMVERQEGYRVVAQCGDFAEAVSAFAHQRPDVVFVDVDLGGADGLSCAKVLTELNPKVKIIFATAHSEYMANAFEIYAFDYLVKPFNMERLKRTLDRIRRELHGELCQEGKNVPQDRIVQPELHREKLLIRGKERSCLVDVAEIIFAERSDKATNIVTDTECYRTSISLSDLEEKLPKGFMRCHKSYLVNLSKITRMEPYGRWTYLVRFRGTSETALMTARSYEEVRQMFS